MPPIKHLLIALTSLLFTIASCRGDDQMLIPPTTQTTSSGGTSFYLLNEGNMGSNKATLDHYDGTTGTYRQNIFPSQNPTIALELGDVGNDLAIYGQKLYASINASGLIEVMNANNAQHIAAITLPNCRYLAFHQGKAYATSYAGPIAPNDPTARPGIVARIDTATLTIEATCQVGYQPEQMAILDNLLFVANSGGYRAPNYDTTITVIDLTTFTPIKTINVAPNLHLLKLHNDRLYVSSRGNYNDLPPDIYIVNPHTLNVEEQLGIEADAFCFFQDALITLSGAQNAKSILRHNLTTRTSQPFITDGTLQEIKTPYALAPDEATNRLYITDARDYVSPGTLHCYNANGQRLWQAQTGDIPAHFAFTNQSAQLPNTPNNNDQNIGISQVFEYQPAPGQFVNLLPQYTPGDTPATMCQKILNAIGHNRQGLVTLGSAGGYLIAGFPTRVPNHSGEYDLEILGNAFQNASEAGIVSVMRDDNNNHLPDDTWYELAGSDHNLSIPNYTLTYTRPTNDHQPVASQEPWCYDAQHIHWTDHQGSSGYLPQNIYHRQPYFPQWIDHETLTYTFTLLPNRAYQSGNTWLQPAFPWGYADNQPNGTNGCRFNIDWAIHPDGTPAHLDGIDFIRIHTAVFRQMDAIGEASTEISTIRRLH